MSDLMPDSLSHPVSDTPKPGMKFRVANGFFDTAIEITINLAAQQACSIELLCDGITMVVQGDSDLEETTELYREKCARETLPSNRADQDSDALSAEQIENEIQEEIENIEFDPGNDITWEALKKSLPDDPVIKIADRWARLMQVRSNEEEPLTDILEDAYEDAIGDQKCSGKIYLQALEILRENWVSGNDLCRAHNWIYSQDDKFFPIKPPVTLVLEM